MVGMKGGAVWAVPEVSSTAKAYSFQAKIRQKIAVEAMPVAACGNTTDHLVVIEFRSFGDVHGKASLPLRGWPMCRRCNGMGLAETEGPAKQRPAGDHPCDVGQV